MIVFYSRKAEADLAVIGDYIARDNRQRAASFIDQLASRCEELADIPYAFPLFAADRDRHIRRRVHGRYSILYRIKGDTVIILHVLQSNRDVDRLLFGD